MPLPERQHDLDHSLFLCHRNTTKTSAAVRFNLINFSSANKRRSIRISFASARLILSERKRLDSFFDPVFSQVTFLFRRISNMFLNLVFPDPARRSSSSTCGSYTETGYSHNFTYHYHLSRRCILFFGSSFPRTETTALDDSTNEAQTERHVSPEVLLDLHACCQYTACVLCSGLIPGVLTRLKVVATILEPATISIHSVN